MENEKNVVGQSANENPTELKRGIKGWQVAFIGLGGVIGSCYFLGVGGITADMGPAVFLAFAVVGLIVYGLMIAYAELLVNLPRKGTFVAYTREFLGETWSVGMGWSFWFNWVCYVPSEAIAVAYVLKNLTGNDSPVAYIAFATGALAALTIINLCAVDVFAKIEAGLAITKVCVIILFIIIAFGIWVGFWGSQEFIGTTINFGSTTFGESLFPNGAGIVLTSMVVVLVTFQGTEIVGLAAAEAQNPDESVPKACKSVTYRIVALYLLPIILIILIYPTTLGSYDTPIFGDIMNFYGFSTFGYIFSAVVLVAAFSCANTGFYGTVRCMYGLSVEGLAPKFLSKLNKSANPKNAVIFTLVFMWVVLCIGLYSEVTGALASLYESLLSMSGFTGTLAWVGIIASQIVFRKRLRKSGYNPDEMLQARVKPAQRWIPWFAMFAQLACLVLLAFGEGQLPIFFIACSAVVIPMIVRVITKKTGNVRPLDTLGTGEKTFEETFPKKI